MSGTPSAAASLGAGWGAGLSAAVAVVASAAELFDLFPRARLSLVFRWRSLLYILINAALAVVALLGLRYLSLPSNRAAELEQVALSGLSARAVLSRWGHGNRGRRDEGKGEQAPERSRSFLDSVLQAVTNDLEANDRQRQTRLIARLQSVPFEQLRPTLVSLLLSQKVEKQSEPRRKEFQASIGKIDKASAEDAAAARTLLLMLAMEWAGEDWLRDALAVFAASYQVEDAWLTAVVRRLDAPVPWWQPKRRKQRTKLLGEVDGPTSTPQHTQTSQVRGSTGS